MNPRGSARASLPGTRPSETHDEAAASRQVREMFSRIAPRYDLLNHLLSMRFDVIWRRRVARRFAAILERPDARVLDLCCGTGDLALALAGAPKSAHGARIGAPRRSRFRASDARARATRRRAEIAAVRSNFSRRMRWRFPLPTERLTW